MILEVKHLSKSFDGHDVINDVNFSLNQGKIYGLLGPSGSGKSVLFHLLAQMMESDEGTIIFKDDTSFSYMQQKDLLLPHLNIINNIALPLTIKGCPKKQAYSQIEPLLATFGLKGFEHLFPQELSGGMKQRASLLRATVNQPTMLLMDEPFSALDALTAMKMRHFVKQLQLQMGTTILFISHNIDEALDLADELFCLGGKPSTISQHLRVDAGLREQQRQMLFYQLTQPTDE